MSKKIRKLILINAITMLAATIAAKTTYTLEIGTFIHKADVQAKAREISGQGLGDVKVKYIPSAPRGYNYKLTAGEFPSKSKALKVKRQFQGFGVQTYVRGEFQYKHDRISAAIQGKLNRYFNTRKGKYVPMAMTTATLQEPYRSLKEVSLIGPTTAPKTLASYRSFVKEMPDSHPLKGREVISLAYRMFSGHSAYDQDRPDYSELKPLLLKVANKQTSATIKQRRRARDMVVRIVHYYEHDYVSAIRAYTQIIKANKKKKPAFVARERAELAGAVYEVGIVSDYSTSMTQDTLYMLWKQNVAIQNSALTSETQKAKDIRYATARIALMLSESFIEQRMWSESEEVAKSIISSYEGYKDCLGTVAEAWCHIAHCYAKQKLYNNSDEAADNAIEVASKIKKKIWGDPTRDVIFKAYTWKWYNRHMQRDKAGKAKIEALMRAKFKGNPGLSKYMNVEAGK